jgi:hypothetical protein
MRNTEDDDLGFANGSRASVLPKSNSKHSSPIRITRYIKQKNMFACVG